LTSNVAPPSTPVANLVGLLEKRGLGLLLRELASATRPRRARAIAAIIGSRRRSGPDRIADLERATAIDPSYFRSHSFLGYARASAGDRVGALAAFDAALAARPDDVGATIGRARGLIALDRTDDAVRCLRAAAENHAEAWPLLVDLLRDRADELDGIWPMLLAALDEGGREAETIAAALEVAAARGETAAAEELAAWLRASQPASGSALRHASMEVLGASAERAAWWADNIAGYIRDARRPTATKPAARPAVDTPDLVAACRRWEVLAPVHEWTIDGVAVWPVIRVHYAFQLMAAARGSASVRPPSTLSAVERASATMRDSAAFWRAASRRPAEQADVVFVGTSSQRQTVDGVAYDRLFDPIADAVEAAGARTLHLEYRGDETHYQQPARRPSVYIRPAIEGIMRAPPRQRSWSCRLEGYDALTAAVQAELTSFGPARAPIPPPSRWTGKVGQLLRLADWFESVLAKARPALLFGTSYFTTLGWAALLAARRLGVHTVDVQHGVTSGHPAYDGWTKIPDAGYALLPDTFWAWTERDAERVGAWEHAAHRAVVGGHPWVAHCVRQGTAPADGDAGRRILVSLNWSTGLADSLKSAIAASPTNWTWWVRLHPARDERGPVVSWLESQPGLQYDVDGATSRPLPMLLAQADAHLTLSSSVTQEATRLGVPSVVLDPRGARIYGDEISAGWARYEGGTGASVIAALDAQVDRRPALEAFDPYPSSEHVAQATRALLDAHR